MLDALDLAIAAAMATSRGKTSPPGSNTVAIGYSYSETALKAGSQ